MSLADDILQLLATQWRDPRRMVEEIQELAHAQRIKEEAVELRVANVLQEHAPEIERPLTTKAPKRGR